MALKLVIFDCDGVLIDSEPVTERLMSESFARYGLHIPPHEVSTLFTGGTMKGAGEEARRMGAALPDSWVSDMNRAVAAVLIKGVPVIDGLFELLDALDTAGVAQAVASNGPMAKMQASLGASGLWDRFTGRIYSGYDHAPKPAPDMLLHAMQVADACPSETVFIDDSPSGCKAGQAAGVRTFGLNPQGDTRGLAAVGAIPVTSLHEVQTLLGLGALSRQY